MLIHVRMCHVGFGIMSHSEEGIDKADRNMLNGSRPCLVVLSASCLLLCGKSGNLILDGLNPFGHLLALVAHTVFHLSTIRFKCVFQYCGLGFCCRSGILHGIHLRLVGKKIKKNLTGISVSSRVVVSRERILSNSLGAW